MSIESSIAPLTVDIPVRPLSLRFKGDDILRKRCEPVHLFTTELDSLLNEMLIFMRDHNGIGLAAPQIGCGFRIIVAEINRHPIKLVNPEIVIISDRMDILEEGCLSIPNETYVVERPLSIEVKARTPSGGHHHFKVEGFSARVLQHEIDHLDGVMICDKMNTRT